MIHLENRKTIYVENFLTSTQKERLNQCDTSLKNLIIRFLSSKVSNKIDSASLVLDIVELCKKNEFREVRELFLLTLMQDVDYGLNEHLEKMLKICQRGGEKALFRCATTPKMQFFDANTLITMIDSFYSYTQFARESLEALNTFPAYDEGGQEILDKMKNKPQEVGLFFLNEKEIQYDPQPIPLPNNFKGFLDQDESYEITRGLAIQYLSSLKPDHRSSMDVYISFFRDLQKDRALFFGEMEKTALLKLIVLSTSNEQEVMELKYTLADLAELLEEIKILCQNSGEDILLSVSKVSELRHGKSLDDVIKVFKFFNVLSKNLALLEQATTLIREFTSGQKKLSQLLVAFEEIAPDANLNEIDAEADITEILKRFKQDPQVSFPLSDEKLEALEFQYQVVQGYCEEWKQLRIGKLVNLALEIRNKAVPSDLDWLKLLAIGRLALRIKFQMYAHHTQVLTILGLLGHAKGCVSQVKTGEGKSLIVALQAFTLVMQNKGVHIISSSQQLATRDQRKTFDFFKTFDVATSHICANHCPSKSFKAPILYGTGTDFEFALMREMLFSEKLFPQEYDPQGKRFDYVLIDELDNLTIDTASNSARLSYPSEVTYDWVYAPIFEFVKKNLKINDVNFILFHEPLREFLKVYLNGKFKDLISKLPDDQLHKWLQSAHKALFTYEEEKDYIVKSNEILIIDAKNTGRIQHGSRWSEGLHEFVEVKHNLPPQKESLCPIAMSHPVYYDLYRCIYGLSGTLGSLTEREVLRIVYHMESFDVPTYRPCLRQDKGVELVSSNQILLDRILATIKSCRQNRRPFLGLFPTIHHTKIIQERLIRENIPHEMLNEIQEKNEEFILAKAGLPEACTIATNIMTRGADILLNEESIKKGGLHVCVAYYPESDRVKNQSEGRAGRQGQPGSSEILVSIEDLNLPKEVNPQNPEEVLAYLQQTQENRIQQMKYHQICLAELERYCFSIVQNFYDELNQLFSPVNQDIFLKKYAELFSDLRVGEKKQAQDLLNPLEQPIVDEVFKLLMCEHSVDPNSWKIILTRIGKRVKDKIIHIWSLDFYHKLTVITHRFAADYSYLQNAFVKILKDMLEQVDHGEEAQDIFKDLLNKAKDEKLDELKQEIKKLYEESRLQWKELVNPTGSGILDYLQKLVQVQLIEVVAKIRFCQF